MAKAIRRVVIGAALPLVLGAAAVAAEKAPDNESSDPTAACARMMQDVGVTDQGKQAMQEFMQSPHAPEAMANMMAMARRMGNGDVVLGMTKMMEMMGGDLMKDQGGMMQPGPKPQE